MRVLGYMGVIQGGAACESETMGQVVGLARWRAAQSLRAASPCRAAPEGRRRGAAGRAWYHFDLACPFSYLAAERVDRGFGTVAWVPSSLETLRRGSPPRDDDEVRTAAERRAGALRMP